MENRSEQKDKISLPVTVTEKIRRIFPDFNPSKLKEDDLKMWRTIKTGKVKPEDYETYRRSVEKAEGGHNASTTKSSRLMFVYFLGGQVQNKLFSRELKYKHGEI